jgi:hypothetical protein
MMIRRARQTDDLHRPAVLGAVTVTHAAILPHCPLPAQTLPIVYAARLIMTRPANLRLMPCLVLDPAVSTLTVLFVVIAPAIWFKSETRRGDAKEVLRTLWHR